MKRATNFTYKELYDDVENLSIGKVILGLVVSTIIMVGSTWGILTLLNFVGVFSFDPSRFLPYTIYMLAASFGTIILAVILCGILTKWPRTVSLALRLHRRAKKHAGDYFLSPEPDDETLTNVFRRSLYGSILVIGIALTIIGFDLMGNLDTNFLILLGTVLMWVMLIILPFTIMLLYFGPWLMKDSGLFHIDSRDRSLSNVGDDVEDILEFFAGVDIVLVWIELTINVEPTALWIPLFIIIVSLGPLFAVLLNFTLIFMVFKERATLSMINFLQTRYDIPDVLGSPGYIRSQVTSLVDRELFAVAADSAGTSTSQLLIENEPGEMESDAESEIESEPEPQEEEAAEREVEKEEEKEEEEEEEKEKEVSEKRDHIPPPPGG